LEPEDVNSGAKVVCTFILSRVQRKNAKGKVHQSSAGAKEGREGKSYKKRYGTSVMLGTATPISSFFARLGNQIMSKATQKPLMNLG
jgi:hypothetical protein